MDAMNRHQKERREREHRRALIDELHFSYMNLVRLLRAMATRELSGRLSRLLADQAAQDQRSLRITVELALDMGMPPRACVCAEAEALIAGVYHADRQDRKSAQRELGILERLRSVRAFLILQWGRLLDSLGTTELLQGHKADMLHVQTREAEHHRAINRAIQDLMGEGDRVSRRLA